MSGAVLFSEKIELVDDGGKDPRTLLTDPKTGKELVYSVDVQGDLKVFEDENSPVLGAQPKKVVTNENVSNDQDEIKQADENIKPDLKKEVEKKKNIEVKKPEVKAEKPLEPLKKTAPVVEKKTEPVKDTPVKPEPLKKETAKTEDKKTETAKVEDKIAEPLKTGIKGNYVLQLLAFQDKDQAIKKAREIKSKFSSVYILKSDLGDKGIWYRIRCCKTKDSLEAEKMASDVEQKLNIKPMVLNLE